MADRSRRETLSLFAQCESMRRLAGEARRLAAAHVPVLVEGESGVGKELIARALHEWGPRSGRRFVVGNCAAIPDALAEAEFFGHVVGAFTGALRERKGLFEAAEGGTVFLDELGEMTLGVQAKLLRVLEGGEYRRLGENDTRRANARVVAATNRDLDRAVVEGRFREDLFYRVAVVRLRVPPLRERRDEIPELARQLLAGAAGRDGGRAPRLSDDAIAALCAYRWPGNVRELRNEMERALALHGGREVVDAAGLSSRVRPGSGLGDGGRAAPGGATGAALPAGGGASREFLDGRDLAPAAPARGSADVRLRVRLDEVERSLLCEALERYGWNKSRAARELGMTRQGLAKKLVRFRIPQRRGATEARMPLELGIPDATRDAASRTALPS